MRKNLAKPKALFSGTAVRLIRRLGVVLEKSAFALLVGRQALNQNLSELKRVIGRTKSKFIRSIQWNAWMLIYPPVFVPVNFRRKEGRVARPKAG